MAPKKKNTPAAKKAPVKSVKVAVKRERSPSVDASTSRGRAMPPTTAISDEDVYKTLARRMGGQELFSFTDNEDKTTPKTAVSIADVVPYMWKEKPLDATLKKLLEDDKKKTCDLVSIKAQIDQIKRRFSIMWNDCIFSGLSAKETLLKVSLDPQAWLIAEAAMEIVLQVKYPQEDLESIQKILKLFKSMVPLELLLNPVTGKREWERVAYLTETYFIDCEQYYETHEELDGCKETIAQQQYQYAQDVQSIATLRTQLSVATEKALLLERFLQTAEATLMRLGFRVPGNQPSMQNTQGQNLLRLRQ